MYQPHKV